MQRRRIGPAIDRFDPNADVFFVGLGVFDADVEIAVVVEHAGVEQFEFGLAVAAAAILVDQPPIRKLGVRIFVDVLHVRMRRRVVDVEVILFHILAMIAFVRREPEEALLENRIAAVPECRREHENLVAIADARDAVFAPAIGFAASQIVRQKRPGVAAEAVILAHAWPKIAR